MLRRFWLLFAQACTLCVAALFVVATLRPDLLPRWSARGNNVVVLQEAAGNAPAAPAAPAATYSEAARKAMPAVVNVYSSKAVRSRNPVLDDSLLQRYFPELRERAQTRRATSLGSGVIVSADGYILTNHHVVEGADEIEVVLNDGRQLSARIRGSDPESDLAVLTTETKGLPAIAFATADSVQVGDVVLAIGNPFGFGNTVTMGIVSALGRNHLGINRFEDFIQTDAAINPGNSGGALVDAAGNLIGINTAIFSRSGGSMGIGFAIPVSTAKMVLEQIVKSGSVTRGWIGVEVQEITPPVAETFKLGGTRGALIAGVLHGGPADKAGIKPGDVLLEVQGKPVADPAAMLNLIAALAPGSAATMKVKRQGQDVDASVTVGRRPKPQARPE